MRILAAVALMVSLVASADRPPTRSKVIDFDGDLIEGVNKRPLDSLDQVSEAGGKSGKAHLYRKRKGFRSENRASLKEWRFAR